ALLAALIGTQRHEHQRNSTHQPPIAQPTRKLSTQMLADRAKGEALKGPIARQMEQNENRHDFSGMPQPLSHPMSPNRTVRHSGSKPCQKSSTQQNNDRILFIQSSPRRSVLSKPYST